MEEPVGEEVEQHHERNRQDNGQPLETLEFGHRIPGAAGHWTKLSQSGGVHLTVRQVV
jgi:hypothetical protein